MSKAVVPIVRIPDHLAAFFFSGSTVAQMSFVLQLKGSTRVRKCKKKGWDRQCNFFVPFVSVSFGIAFNGKVLLCLTFSRYE